MIHKFNRIVCLSTFQSTFIKLNVQVKHVVHVGGFVTESIALLALFINEKLLILFTKK